MIGGRLASHQPMGGPAASRSVICAGVAEPPDPANVRAEFTGAPLERVGSGFESIVYGSTCWVVKVPRDERGLAASLLATVVVGRALRPLRTCGGAPGNREPAGAAMAFCRDRRGPTPVARGARGLPAILIMVPERSWRGSGIERRARWLRARAEECQRLAMRCLDGTPLVPRRVELPPTRIRTARWGRRRTVTTAYQRVDRTLWDEALRCGRLGRVDELDRWLDRFLSFQIMLWRRGVLFAASNPYENHGVLGDRLVLLDHGGLIEDPRTIRLSLDTVRTRWLEQTRDLYTTARSTASCEPFGQRLSDLLQPSAVRMHWPNPDDPGWDG